MIEAVNRHSQNPAEQQMSENKSGTLARRNGFKMLAVEKGSGMMAALGPTTNLAKLESFLPTFHFSRTAADVSELYPNCTFGIGSSFGQDGTPALSTLLRERIKENDEEINRERHRKRFVPAQVHIPGASTPTLRIVMHGDEIVVQCSSRRDFQRIVAADKYCGDSGGRFDTMLVVKKICQINPSYRKEVLLLARQVSPLSWYQKRTFL